MQRAPEVLRVYLTARHDEEKVDEVWRELCEGVKALLDAATSATAATKSTAAATRSLEALLDLASSGGIALHAHGVLDQSLLTLFEASPLPGALYSASQELQLRILRAPRGAVLDDVRDVVGVIGGRVGRGVRRVLGGASATNASSAPSSPNSTPARTSSSAADPSSSNAGKSSDASSAEAAENSSSSNAAEDITTALELLVVLSEDGVFPSNIVNIWLVAFLLRVDNGEVGKRRGEGVWRVWRASASTSSTTAAGAGEGEGGAGAEEGKGSDAADVYATLVARLRGILGDGGCGVSPEDVLRAVSLSAASPGDGGDLKWDVLPSGKEMDVMLDRVLGASAASTGSASTSASTSSAVSTSYLSSYPRLLRYTLALALLDRVGARERAEWVVRHVAHLGVWAAGVVEGGRCVFLSFPAGILCCSF